MQYIIPVAITDAMIISHSVPETDATAWALGTTYAAGALAIMTSTHSVYQSLIGSNTGNRPDISPGQWQRIGPTNRWGAFDSAVGTVTSSATGTITLTLQTNQVNTNAVALLDIDVDSVTVTAAIGATTIYSKTFNPVLSDVGIDNWYSYFFESIEQRSAIVMTDLPPYPDAQITITLTKAGGVSVGSIICGAAYDMGSLQYDASVGIIDYSKKTTDGFGVTTVVERSYAKRLRGVTVIDSAASDGTHKRLSQIRAKPIVWVGTDQYESTIIYGWLREWEMSLRTPTASYVSFMIEGLV